MLENYWEDEDAIGSDYIDYSEKNEDDYENDENWGFREFDGEEEEEQERPNPIVDLFEDLEDEL